MISILVQCTVWSISIISQDTRTGGFPSFSLPFFFLQCAGHHEYKKSMMVDCHVRQSRGREGGREEGRGGREGSLLMLTDMCIGWGRTGGDGCALWVEPCSDERSRQVSLPVCQLYLQGLAQLKHTPLSTHTPAVLPDATKGSSESVIHLLGMEHFSPRLPLLSSLLAESPYHLT